MKFKKRQNNLGYLSYNHERGHEGPAGMLSVLHIDLGNGYIDIGMEV